MKILGNIGSIRKNTNKITSSTFADWSAIRSGSFIKFADDVHFYTVSHTEQKIFLKDFVVVQDNIIQINEDCTTSVGVGDSLNISYKEYELNILHKIMNAGSGYKIGEKLTVGGGTTSLNLKDNTLYSTAFIVNRVGENGEILELSINDRGRYVMSPPDITDLKGGSGKNAVIESNYKLTDHRTFIERDVEKIEFKNSETIIYLSYSLPKGIKEGKLSIEKWEVVLTSNFVGDNKSNQVFHVTRDFTPIYQIPLMTKNTPNQELIFNNAMITVDKKIAELEELIKAINIKNNK